MYRCISIAAALLIAGIPALAAEQNETIQKTFSFSGSEARKVIVDNVNGSIQVTGHAGSDLRMVAHEHIRGDSPSKVDEARRDVKLDVSQDANTVRLFVDGPFRCRNGCVRDDGDRGYEVTFDFELQVPRDTAMNLKTINDGQIKVHDVTGDFEVKNINGGIEMTGAAGSGKVYALNGAVKVTFRENPRAASSFGSLNGEVRVSFQPNLSADLRFKTFNGGIFTDFPVTYLPRTASAGGRRDGARFVYKSNEWSAARVGNGGPELSFDGFNGDIRILSQGQ